MAYYFNKTLALPFDIAIERVTQALGAEGFGIITEIDVTKTLRVERVTQALGAEGFGIITEIDVTKTLRAKLNEDFRPYRILGACNPALVFEALKLEDKVGTMLPCNVVVQEIRAGQVDVAAIDPVASMQAIPNARLLEKAELVGQKLRRVIDSLE